MRSSLGALILRFREEAVAAIREQRSRMRPSLRVPLEALDLLCETTLGMFLTDGSQAPEYPYAAILLVDRAAADSIDGDPCCLS